MYVTLIEDGFVLHIFYGTITICKLRDFFLKSYLNKTKLNCHECYGCCLDMQACSYPNEEDSIQEIANIIKFYDRCKSAVVVNVKLKSTFENTIKKPHDIKTFCSYNEAIEWLKSDTWLQSKFLE